MLPTIGDYLIIGAVAAVVTFVATPVVAWLARKLGWVYHPNERSVHTEPVPDIGGLAMLLGLLSAIGTARLLDQFDALFASNSEPQGVVLAALVVFAVGFVDDIVEIPPPAKVTGIVVAAIVLVWFGATMLNFRVPFYDDVIILSADWVPLVTVVWLLGMTQAINLIDGLDGLAAGIVAIGSGAFFLYANRLQQPELDLLLQPNIGPLVAIITFGVCVGFLPHNFNPARIFMGDSGAFLLGLLLAVSTSVVGGRADSTREFVGQTYFFLAPLLIPLLILGVPMFDTLFAIVRRASRRQALDEADKGHLHHRLMNLGHGHRRSVLILWTWTALLSGFVLYPVLTDENPAYLPFGIGALAVVLFTVLHPSVRARRADEAAADARAAADDDEPVAAADTPDTADTADAAATSGRPARRLRAVEDPDDELPGEGRAV